MADSSNKKQPGKSNPNSQKPSIPIESVPPKEPPSLIEAVVQANKKVRSASQQADSNIPRFDLAEDIMAQQRKNNAQKRKSPIDEPKIESVKSESESMKPENEPVQPKVKPMEEPAAEPPLKQPQTDQIIHDIVAKDIEKLCNDAQ